MKVIVREAGFVCAPHAVQSVSHNADVSRTNTNLEMR
jgi:hypothetical protein